MTDKELTGYCSCCGKGPFTIPELNAHANICEVKRQKASECVKSRRLVWNMEMYLSLSEEHPATPQNVSEMRCV